LVVDIADLFAGGDVDQHGFHWSLLSLRFPWRFNACMTPIRASIVGPPLLSATSIRASTAVCHSSTFCSAFGSFWMYRAASSSVMSWRPRGSGIGSSNGRFQPLAALREEISALLREYQITARRVHDQPAMRDRGFNRSAVFLIAAASFSELPVDDLDRQPPGMVGLNRIRQLKQFSLGGLGRREWAVLFELH
jgi:hypothetical protein